MLPRSKKASDSSKSEKKKLTEEQKALNRDLKNGHRYAPINKNIPACAQKMRDALLGLFGIPRKNSFMGAFTHRRSSFPGCKVESCDYCSNEWVNTRIRLSNCGPATVWVLMHQYVFLVFRSSKDFCWPSNEDLAALKAKQDHVRIEGVEWVYGINVGVINTMFSELHENHMDLRKIMVKVKSGDDSVIDSKLLESLVACLLCESCVGSLFVGQEDEARLDNLRHLFGILVSLLSILKTDANNKLQQIQDELAAQRGLKSFSEMRFTPPVWSLLQDHRVLYERLKVVDTPGYERPIANPYQDGSAAEAKEEKEDDTLQTDQDEISVTKKRELALDNEDLSNGLDSLEDPRAKRVPSPASPELQKFPKKAEDSLEDQKEFGNLIKPMNRSKMSAPNTNSLRNSQGKQSWLEDLEEFHARVDSIFRSLGQFTPADFRGLFGFVDPMNYGYKSLEDLFVMRGCEHEGGGVFIYKRNTCPTQPSSANGNEVFEYPKIPPNVPLGRLIQYYKHVDGVMHQLKRFSLSEFEEKFDPKAHENYGFYSVEHVLSFRGCQRTGEEFVFDELTALQKKALAVASYLNMEFSEFEFESVYRRFFLTNNLTVHLAKRGFDSLRSLLKSFGGVEINGFGDDKGYVVKYVLLTSGRESQGPNLMDVQARADTIPMPSDVVENDSNNSDFGILHERGFGTKTPVPSDLVDSDSSDSDIEILHEHIVTKKRLLVADAAFDGDGEPILKKECPEESSQKHTETFVKEEPYGDSNDVLCPDEEMTLKREENPEGRQEHEKSSNDNTNPASEETDSVDKEEIEKRQERVVNEEADSTMDSSSIPTDPWEANLVYERVQNMGTPCEQWVEKQVSAITAGMDQSIQKEGAMDGTGDAEAGCSTSQPSEAASVDSDDEVSTELMSYHNEFLNAVILGAMKNGVDPQDLGKKVLDRLFEKNPA